MKADNPRDLSTHASLLMRIKQSDPRPRELAWEEFRRRYAPMIAGFARNLGARPQDIDDIIQDVIMGFYSVSPTFIYDPARGRFRGYLKVCTLRALQQRIGQNAKFKAKSIDNVDANDVEVEQVWNDIWEQEHLKRALEELRRRYQGRETFRAFERYVIVGEKPEEVAAALQVSVDSVYKAKERVTTALRELLKDLADEEG
jgi:RNA polymerase sigma-70 factor (ECF subfamily)